MAIAITHPLLEQAGVRHGFFTRQGGVSEGLYAGLNVGVGSKDQAEAVADNRRRCAQALDLPIEALATAYQVHSAVVRVAEAGWEPARPEGDAVVSAVPGVMCGVLTADCAPVLLADVEAGVVGAAHAGWKGALGGVVGSTVHAMQALGARTDRMVAVVGPCIGPDSYEVGDDYAERFAHHDPGSERFFRAGDTAERRLFDLPGFVLWRLEQAGVGEAAWTGDDTLADAERFYSNRRAFRAGDPDFGRMMSAIALG
jgi:YfiH family protein